MLRETHSRRVWAISVAALATVVVVAFALGYASGRGPFAPGSAPAQKLRIALPTTPHAALLYIAAAHGYFAEQGLEVSVMPVSHGKAALDLLTQGQVDLASAAEVPFVISVLRGERLGIAATVAGVSTEMAVVARRDRGIAVPRDLIGKKIGVSFGTSGEYFLWAYLIRHRLAPDSVTLVDVAPGQMVEALTRGTIDAASTWEPIKAKAYAALADNALSLNEADAYTVTHVVIGRGEFLRTHRDAIEKLVRALQQAEAFTQAEPRRALALVADQLKLDVKTLEPGWNDMTFRVDLRQSQLVTLEDEARWAMARGYADPGPVPNFLPNLYLDALLAVRPERVMVVR